jgi:hypothetical protein
MTHGSKDWLRATLTDKYKKLRNKYSGALLINCIVYEYKHRLVNFLLKNTLKMDCCGKSGPGSCSLSGISP